MIIEKREFLCKTSFCHNQFPYVIVIYILLAVTRVLRPRG